LVIGSSELLGKREEPDQRLVLQDVPETPANAVKDVDLFAVFLPRATPLDSVDVIARWCNDPDYAPIVRQGNCVLIGIPVPANSWTTAYADLICQIGSALHDRKLEAYSTARHELSEAGVHEFKLAKRGNPDVPFEKTFYFQFAEPVQLTAQLEHAGSNAVMLIFMGQDEQHLHWTRVDAGEGHPLKIAGEISREDISKLEDRYWTLNVTNFGNGLADCKLTITIEARDR